MHNSPNPYVSFETDFVEEPRTSGLAISALVCSLILCCPVITLIGAVLGSVALATISGNSALKGRGLAIAAIIIGVVFTFAGGYIGYEGYKFGNRIKEFAVNGPHKALSAGASDDLVTFRSLVNEEFASVSDADIRAFFAQLTDRYGPYKSCTIAGDNQNSNNNQGIVKMPYTIQCAKATVNAEVELMFASPNPQSFSDAFYLRIGTITIFDEKLGDLRFPPSQPGSMPPASVPAVPSVPAPLGN